MKVLFLCGNDSDNIQVENVLGELANRGHEICVFSLHTDHHSIRMFNKFNIDIKNIALLDDKTINWADCIFRAHPLEGLHFIGNTVMSKKYTYIYAPYIENHWHTVGGDFMFCCGRSRIPNHREDCAIMAVGCPKNDTMNNNYKSEDICDDKYFLFIDSGHYPFSDKGKIQVAETLLDICEYFPDYKVVVKPRFLPTDKNTIHTNGTHLYAKINELSNNKVPTNLVLLMEHQDMQPLIEKSSCVLMLCTSAYIDVALKNKNMLIIDGIDNEDKYDLRNDIEYRNIYDLRRKSNCVVNYRDVCKYLPNGLECDKKHIDEVVINKSNVSSKIVDVMEYINDKFITQDKFPEIQEYDYISYREDMKSNPIIDWDYLLHKRIKNVGNVLLNSLNHVTGDFNYSELIQFIDNSCTDYDADVDGLISFKEDFNVVKYNLFIRNEEYLLKDDLNSIEYLNQLYINKNYIRLCDICDVINNDIKNYYLSMIYLEEKNLKKAMSCACLYAKEARKHSFAKYECEEAGYLLTLIKRILRFSNDICDYPLEISEVFILANERDVFARLSFWDRRFICDIIPKLLQLLLDLGETTKSTELALLYCTHFEGVSRERSRANHYQRQYYRITNSLSKKLGFAITWPIRKAKRIMNIILNELYTLLKILKEKDSNNAPHYLKILFKYREIINNGYLLYGELEHKFGAKTKYYISAGGTGDVFISNMFISKYIKDNNIDNAVYIIPGVSCYNTLSLFPKLVDVNAINVEKEKWEYLLDLYRFGDNDSQYINLLYYHLFRVYTGCLTWLEGFRGWNLMELMRGVHFPDVVQPERPVFDEINNEVKQLFSKYNLKPNKTVILAPYAKWPPNIPDIFWNELVHSLKENGYDVCTNVANDSETVIEGTYPLAFSYKTALAVINYAGTIIGLRSGLLDIVESASAKKVALYPYNCVKRGIANVNAMNSFSLNEMFYREDWLEVETTLSNLHSTIDIIIEYLKN